MVRTLSAAGDRLLGMLVPRVVAKADPCGALEWRNCYCTSDYRRYMKQCCSVQTSQCGSCVRRGSC